MSKFNYNPNSIETIQKSRQAYNRMTRSQNCSYCNKESNISNISKSGEPFPTCAKCKGQRYCSRTCQKMHWKVHKLVCNDINIVLEQDAALTGSSEFVKYVDNWRKGGYLLFAAVAKLMIPEEKRNDQVLVLISDYTITRANVYSYHTDGKDEAYCEKPKAQIQEYSVLDLAEIAIQYGPWISELVQNNRIATPEIHGRIYYNVFHVVVNADAPPYTAEPLFRISCLGTDHPLHATAKKYIDQANLGALDWKTLLPTTKSPNNT